MLDKYSHNTFFLVRHGEAENTAMNLVSSEKGGHHYHLTEQGKQQVEKTATFLKERGPDFIVSSLITRAKESAEIIERNIHIPLSFDPRLGETQLGKFEDKPRRQFLDFVETHGGRLHGQIEEGIEGYLDIRERVKGFLVAVSQAFNGKKIVVVSHGDPVQEMYGELMGQDSEMAEGEKGWYPAKGSCMLVSKEKNEEYVP